MTAGPATHPERWARLALVLLLAFGALFALVTPPFQAPDEPQHFFRAFEVSEGHLVSVTRAGGAGAFLPYSVPHLAGRLTEGIPFHPDRKVYPDSIRNGFRQRIQSNQRIFVGFMTSVYSFVPYLPAASGIALARVFSDSVLACLYAGRLANVVVAAVLLAAAIGAAPIGSVVLFLLALLPTAVFLMASVSADAFTNTLCFCWIALVLRFAFGGHRLLGRGELAVAVLLAGVLGLTKAGYVLLPSLMWMVPSERFGSRYGRALWLGLCQAAALASLIGWTLRIRRVYPCSITAGSWLGPRSFAV